MGLLRFAGPSDKRRTIIFLVLLLLLATLLRFYGLDDKCLWQDEVSTLKRATAGGVVDVLSRGLNKALPTPPLHFLITHFFLYIGDNDFLLRFPALCFGVLGVAVTYALGARLFGQREGLAGAFLLSISSLHIRYSQDARFYSLLLLLSLFSLYFLYRGIFDKDRKWWIGFTICSILNVYNHLFALLLLLSEMVFVAGLWLAEALLTMRRGAFAKRAKDLGKPASTFDKRTGMAFVVSLAMIALAYAPMLPYVLRGVTGRKGLGGAATGGISLAPSFLIQQLDAWGIGSGWAILVLPIPFVIGVMVCARPQRRQLWLGFCWLMVPFGVLSVLPVGHDFRPRYVLFMLPLYLLFVARGLTVTSEVINARLLGARLWPREVVLAMFLLVIALLSVPEMRAYYAEDRADWRAVAALLARSMSPADLIASPGVFPRFLLPRYEESLREAVFVSQGKELFLSGDLEGGGGIWFVGYAREDVLARHTELIAAVPAFFRGIFEVDDQSAVRGRRLNIAPVMYDDLFAFYVREDLQPQEVIQMYEEALEVVPSSAAFSIHVGLSESYRAEDELGEAVVHYQEAIDLDPYAPEPHYGLALVYEAQGLGEQAASEWQRYDELAGDEE